MTPSRTHPVPPGSRLPGTLQGLRYARDPLGFLAGLHRRYGDVFATSAH